MASPVPDTETRSLVIEETLRRHELAGFLKELASNHILPLLFKGTALAYQIYPEPHLRFRIDTDLLILPAEGPRFVAIAEKHGYVKCLDSGGELIRQQFIMEKVDRFGIGHILDVHLKISNTAAFADLLAYDELVRTSVPLPKLSPHARGAGELHALLIACMHRVAHHHNSEDLIWLYDIHLLLQDRSESWLHDFQKLAEEKESVTICAEGIRLTQQKFGTQLPKNFSLNGNMSAKEKTAAYLQVKPKLVSQITTEFWVLNSWKMRGQFLREHLFPPRAYMLKRYPAARSWNLLFFYLLRIANGLVKSFKRFS